MEYLMFSGDRMGYRVSRPYPHLSGISVQGGFTFIWLLLALLLLALGTQRVFVSAAQQHLSAQKRMQLRLLQTYNHALLAYRDASPGTSKQFPLELQDLLLDKRQFQTRRYLRKMYEDPMQPGVSPLKAWGFVRDAQGRISSMYSIQVNGFPERELMPTGVP